MSEDSVRSEAALASRNLIIGWAEETGKGGIDRRAQALKIAARDGVHAGWVNELFDTAELVRRAREIENALPAEPLKSEPKAEVEPSTPSTPKAEPVRTRAAALQPPKPEESADEEPMPVAAEVAVAAIKGPAAFSFLPSTQPSVGTGPEVAEPSAMVGIEPPKAGRAVLDRGAPLDIARRFVRDVCSEDGKLALRYWQGVFYRWSGTHYEELAFANGEHPEVRGMIYSYLDGARKVGGGDQNPFQPKPADVSNVLDCLKSVVGLPIETQPPMWLDDTGSGSRDWVAFKNKVLNVVTGEAREHSPEFWCHNALDFGWDTEAQCPRWQTFLDEVFKGDPEAQQFLLEWMGYCMTEATNLQKGVMLIGEKRSGKGTISHVLRKLVGDRSYAGLSFNTWVRSEYSKEPLIGKRVGVFADVRFKAGRAIGRVAFDAGGIGHESAELLLNITGEDTITIGRKYKGAWHGQLGMKVMVISNDVPNLNDSQGVLPSRFIKLAFTRSFFGHEDAYLRQKLEAELPGIAAKCVRAYGRLVREQRMFVQPRSGLALERELIEASDPLQAMLASCFVIEHGATCVKAIAHAQFMRWCEQHSRWDLQAANPPQQFSKTLARLVPGLADAPRAHNTPRSYLGIRLRKD